MAGGWRLPGGGRDVSRHNISLEWFSYLSRFASKQVFVRIFWIQEVFVLIYYLGVSMMYVGAWPTADTADMFL